jgi:hypothetical protein
MCGYFEQFGEVCHRPGGDYVVFSLSALGLPGDYLGVELK